MLFLNEYEILQLLEGAAFMAGGGGGSSCDAHLMLNTFKTKYPDKKVEIKLIRPDEMEHNKMAAGIAVMGAPSGGTNLDITNCITNAFDEIKRLAKSRRQTIAYALPLELGGFNTFVPILTALIEDIAVIDADCCGRAVPGLDTTLSHINGCATGPIAMADVENNRIIIQTNDAKDAVKIEQMALPIVQEFHQNAGIAGWVYDKEMIQSHLPLYTLSLCLKIGNILTNTNDANIFNAIHMNTDIKALSVSNLCTISDFTTEQSGGWDIGHIDFQENHKHYQIAFSNENLVLYDCNSHNKNVIATAPDIITIYDPINKKALTNEDLMELNHKQQLSDYKVQIGILKADALWYTADKHIENIWEYYFKIVQYTGPIKSI